MLIALPGVKAQTVTVGGSVQNFELLDKGKMNEFIVPLVIKPDGIANLVFPDTIPAFVQIGGTSDTRYCNGITYRLDPTKTSMTVSVNMDTLDLQGIYMINIRYTTSKPTEKTKIYHLLSFNVVRPPATLQSLNTVTITDEQFCHLKQNPLTIFETSNRTPVRDLIFDDPDLPDQQTQGLLTFAKESNSIGAGERKSFCYTVESKVLKEIDLGTHTGKLYFRSKMMSAPVPVIFVITRKLSKYWIIVTVFLGLLAGYIVRQVLTTKKDNEMVRLTALQLIAEITEFKKQVKAKIFEDQLKDFLVEASKIISITLTSLTANSKKALDDIQQIQNKFDEQKAAYKKLMSDKEEELSKVSVILKNKDLTSEVTEKIGQAVKMLPMVGAAIKANDYDTVKAQLDSIYRTLGSFITDYKHYFSTVEKNLTSDQNYPKAAPETFAKVKDKVTNFSALLQAVTFDIATPTPETLLPAILAINDNQKSYNTLPENIAGNLKMEFIRSKNFQPNDQLLQAIGEWINVIAEMVVNKKWKQDSDFYLETAFERNPNFINSIDNHWTNAQTGLAPDASGGGAEDQVIEKTQAATFSPLNLTNFKFDKDKIQVQLARARKNYLLFNLLQTAILAILIGLGAFKSLEAGFIGHSTEFLAIFLFAFSLDISIANVMQFKPAVL